ncbi:CubicO group peptidase (beta-lactamase class C family) [Paenibacillus mucilaginosus]|uniref:serine hydrolase domain-containing protein n=1 Tax=Paenibacillus mucilaginosus TaxID=61624 RepID=UPI003D21E901
MELQRGADSRFNPAAAHVKCSMGALSASGAAVVIIHNGAIACESYWGRHSDQPGARCIQEDSQFHVASVRKSYIGFAAAWALQQGYLNSMDDEVSGYLPEEDAGVLEGVTFRHLLTHTHGLKVEGGRITRNFPAGTSWKYRSIGVELLTRMIKRASGCTVAHILEEQVFRPLAFSESGWYPPGAHERLVDVLYDPRDPYWSEAECAGTEGDQSNLYVSARELAYWGYLHLRSGSIRGWPEVSAEVIRTSTTLQSPSLPDPEHPRNGCFWFIQDRPSRRTELGERVPRGSYQILGYTGAAVLVIPSHQVVAVRMLNRAGSTPGYDYLADIRGFGDTVAGCL